MRLILLTIKYCLLNISHVGMGALESGDNFEPFLLSLSVGYIYATIANVVITLTAMLGIVALLCTSCNAAFQLCIQFCICMAVGSLTGDALLHLLPMVSDF